MTRILPILTCLSLAGTPTLTAGDSLATQQLEAALKSAQDIVGEPVELAAGDQVFIAIHRAQHGARPRGGVVLLHGIRGSADSREVIRPLRLGLAAAGWDTLSLQLPVARRDEGDAERTARQAAIAERLAAGLAWLKGRQPDRQVVIAQGDSAAAALQLAAQTPAALSALVLVSSPLAGEQAARVAIPLLDVIAQRDAAAVLDGAAARDAAARAAGRSDYRQVAIADGVAGFAATEDLLLSTVRAWLAANSDRR
jgi:pimeloyl-ACP methyl ester carboxylesterase